MIRTAWDWLCTNRLPLLAGAVGGIVPVLLLALATTTDARRETAQARASLAVARQDLARASALLHDADSARADERRRVDSLWGVINALRIDARRRQYTIVTATTDLQTLAAERDTAIADRDEARRQLAITRTVAGDLRQTALTILVRDSTGDARVGALLLSADSAVATADQSLRRPWYRRVGGAVKTGARLVLVGGVGYLIGRGV